MTLWASWQQTNVPLRGAGYDPPSLCETCAYADRLICSFDLFFVFCFFISGCYSGDGSLVGRLLSFKSAVVLAFLCVASPTSSISLTRPAPCPTCPS
ncbi:hypothetical protein ASPWEDRAFT_691335 [Aspergillus wentii DTO 134E9]|uniref:Uncharacterized protein n=1 Tax=Aspergillus wentii DTO 134E9 TaxID=1073089 RepID=A0A1L9R970_ASPWE|nr:uncharacterized protein ASPWEDRAFT_691335 [Aspergillus wentii DTO 134E9]OJJ31407.1 hypothetical protein ASPWEDRAFT_691335 [Aspergillus wentii DTO 134E9]